MFVYNLGMDILSDITNLEIDKKIQEIRFGIGRQSDYGSVNNRISLDSYLVNDKNATFFFKNQSDNYKSLGVFKGDIVVIDRSLSPCENDVVLVFSDGSYKLMNYHKKIWQEKRLIGNDNESLLWGVMSASVRTFRK